MSFQRVPGGYVKTRNLPGAFRDSYERTFGLGSPKAPLIKTSLKDQHTWGKAAMDTANPLKAPEITLLGYRNRGASGRYELHHTEINPYKGGALLVGTAATGYGVYKGAKWAKANPQKVKAVGRSVNKGVGSLYSNHPKAMKRVHYGLGGSTVLFAQSQKSLLGGSAANIAAYGYGLHQQDKYEKALKHRK